MKVAICIDYDNLIEIQKTSGILSTVTRVLQKISLNSQESKGVCHIRLYGGWFEGSTMSQLSQKISVKLNEEFPSQIRINLADGRSCVLNASAELAVALLEEPGHHLFDTYRRKGKPRNIRVETQSSVGCINHSCPLPMASKLLKSGSCPVGNCAVSDSPLVYRHEQKIVDTMLTCDLIYLSQQGYDALLLISEDDDFLPPIRTIVLRGSKIIRIHPKFSIHRSPIKIAGETLIEMEI